jgi:hypothetical protein
MPFRLSFPLALLVLLVAGCATHTPGLKPEPPGPADFAGWPCDALADEAERVQHRAVDLAYADDSAVGNDVIEPSLGTTVFWPALLEMRPDGSDAVELAQLRARYDALSAASRQRACPPAGDLLPPARAGELPVLPGERLVYEERRGNSGPTQEFGLRLQALRRGELDFAVDRGPGSAPALWRQDAAGNALGLHPHRLLGWTHLLHRNLSLGDVLAGDLQGPETGERTARVRGQVIAIGPQVLDGHRFDAATIELFGDAPGSGPGATRIDGVMVVDRASGVLLRLELHSGNPDFAVRRKLLRIEPAA